MNMTLQNDDPNDLSARSNYDWHSCLADLEDPERGAIICAWIASRLSTSAYSNQDVARLCKMSSEEPDCDAYYRLESECGLHEFSPPSDSGSWPLVVRCIAQMTGRQRTQTGGRLSAHDPTIPVGRALFIMGDEDAAERYNLPPSDPRRGQGRFREMQLIHLTQRTDVAQKFADACRRMGLAGQRCDWRELGYLLFAENDQGASPRGQSPYDLVRKGIWATYLSPFGTPHDCARSDDSMPPDNDPEADRAAAVRELTAIGIAVHGREYGWQTRMAGELGVAPRTMRRWASGQQVIPHYIILAAREILRQQRG